MPNDPTSRSAPRPVTAARLRTAQSRLGYVFKDQALLTKALCHASVRNDGVESNERLEFLGDAVLTMLVSWFLHDGLRDADEGLLTARRAQMIQGPSLAAVARELKLGELIKTGKGQDIEPTENMEADLLEACIGAIFLDGGLEAAQDFVVTNIIATHKPCEESYNDPKSRLQHFTLSQHMGLPEYELLKTEGPGHSLVFSVEVRVDGKTMGKGRGSSKKLAQQLAAEQALKALRSAESGSAVTGDHAAGTDRVMESS